MIANPIHYTERNNSIVITLNWPVCGIEVIVAPDSAARLHKVWHFSTPVCGLVSYLNYIYYHYGLLMLHRVVYCFFYLIYNFHICILHSTLHPIELHCLRIRIFAQIETDGTQIQASVMAAATSALRSLHCHQTQHYPPYINKSLNSVWGQGEALMGWRQQM